MTLTILVADDDPIHREFAREHLQDDTTRVLQAGDGVEALEVVQAEPVDLLLLDLHMPRMEGFDVLSRVRQIPGMEALPVVVATVRRDKFAIHHAFERGATWFVAKPVDWPLLKQQLPFLVRNGHHPAEAVALRAGDTTRRLAAA